MAIDRMPPKQIIVQVEPIAVRIDQAAELMGASPDTIRKWIDKAGFPHTRVGSRIICSVAKMRQWADENNGKTITF